MTEQEKQESIISKILSADRTLCECKEILQELVGYDESTCDVSKPASAVDTIEELCKSMESSAKILFNSLNTLRHRLTGGCSPEEYYKQ